MRRLVLLCLVACGKASTTTDAGRVDAPVALTDARTPDALATVDATPPDARPCQIVFLPPGQDFGTLDEGMVTADTSFIIQNQGPTATSPVTLSLEGSDRYQFTITSDGCTGLTLGATSGQCNATVHFNPSGAGPRKAMLTISATSCGKASVAVTGVSLGANGDHCGMDGDCQSKNCVDTVCCDKDAASCGGCYSCNVAGSAGTCVPVPIHDDPHAFCSGHACATGGCDGAGACIPTSAGTVCATDPGCTNNSLTYGQWASAGQNVHQCDGSTLDCPTPTALQSCPSSHVCDATGTSCQTSCASDLDCVYGTWCDATTSTCRPPLAPGSLCDRQRQCNSTRYPYGSLVCVAGTCQSMCGALGDPCAANSSPGYYDVCVPESFSGWPSGFMCDGCSNQGGDAACQREGVGKTCTSNTCGGCTSNADCTDPRVPVCDTTTGKCYCFTDGYPNSDFACDNTDVCTRPAGTSLNYGDACKTRTGLLCSTGATCASGVCTNGVCQ